MTTTASEIIRSAIQTQQINKWGFSIYKCNTVSQDRWTKFINLITCTTRASLSPLEHQNQDILNLLSFPIVSDPSLEQASWQEARIHFDKHIRDTLISTLEESSVKKKPWIEQELQLGKAFWTVDDKLHFCIHAEPRFAYILYVDEVAVNSVLDHVDDKNSLEGWIVTLVESGIRVSDDAELIESIKQGLDEEDSEGWGECESREDVQQQRKKVRAWDLITVYATVQSGGWDDDFHEENGVYENPSL